MSKSPRPKFRFAGYERRAAVEGVTGSTALELFRKGMDTAEIAARFKSRSEATIYNALARACEAERAC